MAFALAATRTWAEMALAADQHGCVDVHGLEYVIFLLAGMLLGFAAGPWVRRSGSALGRVLLPDLDERSRIRRITGLATLLILLGMVIDGFWLAPAFNLFIDTHRPLLVEADLTMYSMGALSAAGWYWILDRQSWIGLVATAAMALMVIGSVLSTHSWC